MIALNGLTLILVDIYWHYILTFGISLPVVRLRWSRGDFNRLTLFADD
jgi:hypothetical protein